MAEEPLTNAAVELERAFMEAGNALDGAPRGDGPSTVTHDFVYDDRRTGAASVGRITGRSAWAQYLSTAWAVSERPKWSIREVLAVRGERCAAAVFRVDYGDDVYIEFINCIRMDINSRYMERYVSFDLDASDEAMAELDRLDAQIADNPEETSV